MPKMKTNRSVAKRIRKTGSGKLIRKKAFTSHLLSHKGKRQKRDLNRKVLVFKGDVKRLERLIPYL